MTAIRLGLVVIVAAPVTARSAVGQITVGPNVQVSKARPDVPHFELLSAADPTDPGKLMACSYFWPAVTKGPATIVYASFDGGLTWSPTLDETRLRGTGDPICAYGLDNTAYYVTLTTPNEELHRKIANTMVFRSTDGGRTWGAPDSTTFLDREFAFVDATNGPYRGTLYINGTYALAPVTGSRRMTAMGLLRSRDGKHFAGPTARLANGRAWIFGMGNAVALSDGTLLMVMERHPNGFGGDGDDAPLRLQPGAEGQPNAVLEVISSTDGGQTLGSAVRIADINQPPLTFWSINPYLAVDPSTGPFKDRVYVVWPDERSGRSEIYVAYSSDKGATWSNPQIINDDPETPDTARLQGHILPVIGVNRNGVVGMSWYDRRDSGKGIGWYLRFTASLDGGDTWLPSVRVSEQPANFETLDRFGIGFSAAGGGSRGVSSERSGGAPVSLSATVAQEPRGDYSGMAVDAGGVFHPTWVDNRTGVSQIWTAPISISGSAGLFGGGSLANLADWSSKVELSLGAGRFDPVDRTVMFNVRLVNRSKDTIRAPIKARVIAVRSQLGSPRIANADEGGTGPGAVLDFTSLIRDGILLPGDSSASRLVVLRLGELRSAIRGTTFRSNLVTIEARILAAKPPEKKDRMNRLPGREIH